MIFIPEKIIFAICETDNFLGGPATFFKLVLARPPDYSGVPDSRT